jgi:hypothetical protein
MLLTPNCFLEALTVWPMRVCVKTHVAFHSEEPKALPWAEPKGDEES